MAMKLLVLDYDPDKNKRHENLQKAVRAQENCEYTEIHYSEKGKPILTGVEKYRHISVTTTGKYTVAALSDKKIGIDGEWLLRFTQETDRDYQTLAERFFTEDEAEYVRDCAGDCISFAKIWVRKEAYVKYTGRGMSEFSEFSVSDGEKVLQKVFGVPIKKLAVPIPDEKEYLFVIAGEFGDIEEPYIDITTTEREE